MCFYVFFFFFQAEDGIRDVERSRGLGDVYKRQVSTQSTWDINMIRIFGLMLIVASLCHLGAIIPPPKVISAENVKCLINAKQNYIMIRGYISSGTVDPYMKTNVKTAVENGITTIDLVFNPCVSHAPEEQAMEFIDAIKGIAVQNIWINVDVPGWREFKNFNILFMEDLLAALSKSGKNIGIFSSKFLWEDNFGSSFHGASSKRLMYENLNKDPSFKDFKSFGGWKKPYAKCFDLSLIHI
eukprot:TRINITY_DN7360_c0_g1_i4.p1 TRINITY_DN7360_c0_g1~~TRINITY_DN7360_c0_g1_i4.p1  ORF type:complete len:241 (-),score=52.42 TRINITY_DN7360_c0_g1_i4:145-867(-)